MLVINIRRRLACTVVSAIACLAVTASTAAALNPQPLPPSHTPPHLIPTCLPAWACG